MTSKQRLAVVSVGGLVALLALIWTAAMLGYGNYTEPPGTIPYDAVLDAACPFTIVEGPCEGFETEPQKPIGEGPA